jgi:hypothetical protein
MLRPAPTSPRLSPDKDQTTGNFLSALETAGEESRKGKEQHRYRHFSVVLRNRTFFISSILHVVDLRRLSGARAAGLIYLQRLSVRD